MALSEQEELELLTLEREKSSVGSPSAAAVPAATAKPLRSLTRDNPGLIDDFLIGALSRAPGLGNAPDIQGSIPGRLIQGAADLPVGALQLAANVVGAGNPVNERIAAIEERTNQLRGPNAGFDWARLAGNVASPAALMAAAKVPLAATRMGKIGQGVGIGAVAGATAPVTDGGENFASSKALQTAGGMALGGAIPAVAPLVTGPVKAGYHALIEPWLQPAAIKGRAFLEAAGEKADDIIRLLRENKEIVPGSRPIAGEAAADAGATKFSALQKQAADIAPDAYAERGAQQNAARLSALRTGVAGDAEQLAAAETARKARTDPLYRAATAQGNLVETFPVKFDIEQLLSRNPGNRELVGELNNVKKGLLYANGELRTEAGQVASVIDGLKTAIAKEDNKFIAGTLRKLKTDLEKAIPGYESAQKAYRQMSAPVNQMQVGQHLEQKLVPALSDDAKQRSSVYAQAVRDAPGTIKRSTGQPRFDELTDVLTPQQMSVVNGIRDDLARGAKFEDLARKGAKAAPDISAASGDHKITGMFDRTITIANAIIGRLEGKVNKRLAAEIASEMLNPPKVAETLAQAQARAQRNKALATMVEKSIQTGTLGATTAAQRK